MYLQFPGFSSKIKIACSGQDLDRVLIRTRASKPVDFLTSRRITVRNSTKPDEQPN
jgi:hypothetical protein